MVWQQLSEHTENHFFPHLQNYSVLESGCATHLRLYTSALNLCSTMWQLTHLHKFVHNGKFLQCFTPSLTKSGLNRKTVLTDSVQKSAGDRFMHNTAKPYFLT